MRRSSLVLLVPVLAGVLAGCGGAAHTVAQTVAHNPTPSPVPRATASIASDGLFHGPGFVVAFPTTPTHVVKHFSSRRGPLTFEQWAAASGTENRTVWVMSPAPRVPKGSVRTVLTGALERYWATYHMRVVVDSVPLEVSGASGVSFVAANHGQGAIGEALIIGTRTYVVFYLDRPVPDAATATDFAESFALT